MAKISGVYKLQSKAIPERIYIGSSVDISNRISQHFTGMLHGYSNVKMIKHFIEFEREDFEVTIIEECPLETLRTREQYYIDLYKPYFNDQNVDRSNLHTEPKESIIYEDRVTLHRALLDIRKRMHKEYLNKHLIKVK
jgi:group I intron endonuclease